jgi:hypothetical protein
MFLCFIRRSHAEKVAAPLLLITNSDREGEFAAICWFYEKKSIYLLDMGEVS